MNKTLDLAVAPTASQELERADESHEQALHNLGKVASGSRPVGIDEHSQVITAGDWRREADYQRVHGHSSDETATGK